MRRKGGRGCCPSTGGRIRGLFALQYAKRIEALLREKHGKPDLVLADHFHYIGWTSTGAIIPAFLSWGLSVEDDGTPSTFGTGKLKTLLLVVTRNPSTGSPWPISNNPGAKYNNPDSPGNNLQIRLWQLVRASTAAPTFFPPEILRVKGEMGEELGFAFEDGGITPFNNPAYLMKIMATLPEYRLG